MKKEQWQKEIKENWFKGHKATLKDEGSLKILEWRTPDTITFYVRYVFDGCNMYVSGDIGEAVFRFSQKADPFVLAKYNLDYFEEKLEAFSRTRRNFVADQALEDLEQRIKDHGEEGGDPYPEEAVKDLKEIINDCSSQADFHTRIHSEMDLYQFGSEYYEWLPDLGEEIPGEIRAYLIGLQMATEQLKPSEVEAEPVSGIARRKINERRK
jgi:hypothetical protein